MADEYTFAMRDNTKLVMTTGFAAMLALMFILVFVALDQFKSFNQSMTVLVEKTNAKIEAAHVMRDAIRMRANTLKAMQLTDNAFERDEGYLRLIEYAGLYRIARERLLSSELSSAELDINDRLSEATRAAQPLNDHAAELLHSGVTGEVAIEAIQQAEQAQEALLVLLDELVELEKQSTQQAVNRNIGHYHETRDIMFLLAAFVLILGAVIATFVIRQAANRNRRITYQASHDALTGLANRCEMERQIQNALMDVQRSGSEHALLYVDLDQFKAVNDTCGHMAGDRLLVEITGLLRNRLRSTDSVGRLGGDEFAILLKDCPEHKAVEIGESLRQCVERFRFPWDGKIFSVSASIGIAPITNGSQKLADVLSVADMACYTAKQGGRNRIHTAGPGDQSIVNQRWESERLGLIKRALEAGRFELYYQAIVPVRSSQSDEERIEILARMIDDDGELVLPGDFIPTAERFNYMSAIDRYVVRRAFEWLSVECRKGKCPTVMINLSGQSLSDDCFLKYVLDELQALEAPPGKICFEVTETVAMSNLSKANTFIATVKGLGCQFALDDFGSGFSSFSYLKELAVDYLKIDGSFVRSIEQDEMDYAMVKAINEIGHVLNKKTIAEFVENDAVLARLRQLGVDYAQGYGISRPQPLIFQNQSE